MKAEEDQLAQRQAAAAAAARDLAAREAAAQSQAQQAAARAEAAEAERTRAQRVLAVFVGPLVLAQEQPQAALIPLEPARGGLALLQALGREALAQAAAAAQAAKAARREREAAMAALPSLSKARLRQVKAQAELTLALARSREAEAAAQAAAQAEAQAAAEAKARAEAGAAARAAAEAKARTRFASLSAAAPPRLASLPVGGIGRLVLPVGGKLENGWHSGSDGVTFAAAPGAEVVAPCAGKVDFAEPFRSYNRLVIIDCGRGWRTVLGGLALLATHSGKFVRQGTPLGSLPADGPQRLYFELRQGTKAVDPTPYLALGH